MSDSDYELIDIEYGADHRNTNEDTTYPKYQKDPEYIDNYYNDDLEKSPNMQKERFIVLTIYASIILMVLYSIFVK